jgi:hypothetical protein
MRTTFAWEWEELDGSTIRIRVIGGWLVRHVVESGRGIAESMVFIADKDHEWKIKKPSPPSSSPNESVSKQWKTEPEAA